MEVRDGILGAVSKDSVELVAPPFNAVLNLVGEITQGAHWDGFLRWILGVSIALGLVWDNHL